MDERNGQDFRLNEMDGQQARQLLTEVGTLLSPEKWYALCHEDYVMEMPQSGERFPSRDNLRAFQEAAPEHYSTPPGIRVDRVRVREGLWVKEGVNDYGGGRVMHSAVIYELKEGKIWRDTRYYAEPFEAPDWRARWVERMETGRSDAMDARDGRRDEMDQNETRSKPVPDLAAMDEREATRLLRGLATRLSPAAEYELRHEDDYVMEMPQSGERIRGRENLLALREAYPAGVEFEVRRVIPRPDLGVSEYVIRYDGRPVHVLAIVEFRDGKVVRETHYFAEPFEAPAWRSRRVQKMGA